MKKVSPKIYLTKFIFKNIHFEYNIVLFRTFA